MTRFFLICLGGAIGTGARYLTTIWAAETFGPRFPAGTLIVNLAGSFLIALIVGVSAPSDFRLMLTAGVMGGFTTYSSFNFDTTELFRRGAWLLGALNLGATVLGCMAAGVAGIVVARLVSR